ncbi:MULTISPECIES: 30S ribosomal protein S9 [Halobacterium]|uniref:Small ribosomal subunit protein uS9 n=4 Tax=Halobacterium salinarum TaxID=2242 RepID=RS9_HALSA|nr:MULTISPECIES: 30S ribosomal protein S9 [Halobacterium]Q9HQJ2.3 RecName: Full=Small ribosomal subunit protein uS9; AltName: Full=30S ribosomal protein S9 [Halobacterium salinarum NRC-1]MCF2165031.1 30S ribosomal protein S9 [Halobacterium salinarum]MCF2168632.1 30S ribosomal protein S9 [Halobacterium salinarum]MCF2208257.1 30S ribosomal protein S9 [Halobacterium salinarum]MCF2238214.1 30S ribosomal protein S9 [Halobacterium salinarum]MCF2241391.1 30S ribosomal protein S9 [Halobacterium salin
MVTNTSGKKKTAVARATVSDGEGRVRINSQPVELVEPEMARLKMLEPFRISGSDLRGDVDIDIDVAGGGFAGQADAVRTAIARGLVEHYGDAELRDAFREFDRSLLVNDVRQRESKKWGGPGARARYQKSYR